MENNNIQIVVASDNHYSIHIAALLKSIDINHLTEEHIYFNVIDDGISEAFKKKLETMADPIRITIRWFESRKIIPVNVVIPIDSSSFPLTVYMRVFSPYIQNQSIDKLIYLDVDTLVQGDISNLWNINLDNYIIGAVQDVGKTVDCNWGGIPNYKQLGLKPTTKYFNSGVLLINAKKWREEEISKQVISTLGKYKEHVRLADQYGLNVVFANKWLELDPKWNWFAFKENINPYIIHFLDIKPIFKSYKSNNVFKEEFYRYLSLTPWKDFKPISGNYRQFKKLYTKIKKTFFKR